MAGTRCRLRHVVQAVDASAALGDTEDARPGSVHLLPLAARLFLSSARTLCHSSSRPPEARERRRCARTRCPCGRAWWRRHRRRGSCSVRRRPREGLLGAPPVLVEGLAHPGEHRDAAGGVRGAVRAHRDGRGGVILGREDVAGGPADLGAEVDEGLVRTAVWMVMEGAGDAGSSAGTCRRPRGGPSGRASRARREDLVATELGQVDVLDLVLIGSEDLVVGGAHDEFGEDEGCGAAG